MIRLMLPVVGLAVLSSCISLPTPEPRTVLTDDQRAALTGEVAAVRDRVATNEAARREAVRADLAAPPATTGEPCTVAAADVLGVWDPEDLFPAPSSMLHRMVLDTTDLWFDDQGPLRADEGPLQQHAVAVLSPIAGTLDRGDPLAPGTTEASLHDAIDGALLRHTLTLVVQGLVKPKTVTDTTFEGGTLQGRLLLWDAVEGRHVCATQVKMSSLPQARAAWNPATGMTAASAASSRIFMDLVATSVVLGAENLEALPVPASAD